ncbi:MAG: imidazolonepropionase [Ardenticatenia bacterium]|nr:MAG: imidazolonepropionase [Ardenticatenia bacterium]
MRRVDLLIHHADQLVTCAAPQGAKRGSAMADVGIIPDGAVAVDDGQIVAVGPSKQICAEYTARRQIDVYGHAVCPGLVDAHTHVVYAGDRVEEFEQRLRGQTYLEILEAGGGILTTVRATRAASLDELVISAKMRLDTMLALGTTTAEVKTGYALDVAGELKMLAAIATLAGAGDDHAHPVDLVPTFLGAHAIPPEYRHCPDDYLDEVIEHMLPAVRTWYHASPFICRKVPLFCDVFCEKGAFDLRQSERVLQAALALGMPVKIHADEFNSLGGVALAVQLGAVSADHLDVTSSEEIAQLAASTTVGVLLPAVNFHLGNAHFAPARAMIDAGVAIALATDLNPGSAPCPSLPLVMAIACRYQKLQPAEALNACTINAAQALGMGDRIGSIEVGKQADLLILKQPDYRHLMYQFGVNPVAEVIKRGQTVL